MRTSLPAWSTAVLVGLAYGSPAVAAVDPDLYAEANCARFDAAPLAYVFCDDGVPAQGGTTPNPDGEDAVTVPAKYSGHAGLPPKAGDATAVPGANASGDIALDVDVAIPLSPPPVGGYPMVVFMHGCCSGNKRSWESGNLTSAGSFDAGGERWHYNNAWFASRGYVAVTYTSRGFRTTQTNATPNRGSTGQTQIDSRVFEINDFQHLACQLVGAAGNWTGKKGAGGGAAVAINPAKIVATGGSYGGGFAWMALTDPKWTCTPDTGTSAAMSLAAAAPRYGWTDLLYSLVPTGRHFQLPGQMPATNGCDSGPRRSDGSVCDAGAGDPVTPVGIPKTSIVAALYASGATGAPSGSDRATFPPEIDAAEACLTGPYPVESNPACGAVISTTLPEFLRDRSAYYQSEFFASIAADPAYRVPVFNVATLTDPLFPMHENRRMHNRLRAVVPGYPLQTYFMDNQHFVQNKAKDWADVCGTDRHACNNGDYAVAGGGFDFNAAPRGLRRQGATSRLNRFVDHYAAPSANPAAASPAFGEAVALQVCPETAAALGHPADESGDMFQAATFESLANGTYAIDVTANQSTTSTVTNNSHAADADPIANTASNSSRCVVHPSSQPAGPGVAVFDGPVLGEDVFMIGAPALTLDFAVTSLETSSIQLNARLYDVLPDGNAIMIDRGPRRLSAAEAVAGRVTFQLHGNAYRFLAGHRIRVEVAQDDSPFLKNSNPPSSTAISRLQLSMPRRLPVSRSGTVLVRPVATTAAAGSTDIAAADFSLHDNGDQGHRITALTIGVENPGLLAAFTLQVEGQAVTIDAPAASNVVTLATPLKVRPGGFVNFAVTADLAESSTAAWSDVLANPAYAGAGVAVDDAAAAVIGILLIATLVLWRTRRRFGAALLFASLALASCSSDDPGLPAGSASPAPPPPPPIGSNQTRLSLMAVAAEADDAQPAAYQPVQLILGTLTRS